METWLQSIIYFDRGDYTNISIVHKSNIENKANLEAVEPIGDSLEFFYSVVLPMKLFIALTLKVLTTLGHNSRAMKLSDWLDEIGTALETEGTVPSTAQELQSGLLGEVKLKESVDASSGRRFEARLEIMWVGEYAVSEFIAKPKGFPVFGLFSNVSDYAVVAVKGYLKHVCECEGKFLLEIIGTYAKLCAKAHRSGVLNLENSLGLANEIVESVVES